MEKIAASNKRALVVGLGVSGIASALALHRAGWKVVILEKAAQRRKGGYFIGLFGTGLTAARRLGVELPDRVSPDIASYNIDRAGRRLRGPTFADAVPGDLRLVVRGDIEEGAFNALPEDVEIRYATVPAALRQDVDEVEVDIRDQVSGVTTTERFDLVVGADGLRSTVRKLAFDPQPGELHRLGYMIAACSLPCAPPGFRLQEGLVLAEPGRSAWVFAFADREPTVLFNYRSDDIDAEFTRSPIEALRAAFGPEPTGESLGWLLDQFEKAPDYLFDSAEQVRIDRWSRGRVVLLGDAAWCLTLYSGMGASVGLAGADLLGRLLERHPDDVPRALQAWEDHLRPFIEFHQGTGMSMRSIFVPADKAEYRSRLVMNQLFNISLFRNFFAKRVHASKDSQMKTVDIAAA